MLLSLKKFLKIGYLLLIIFILASPINVYSQTPSPTPEEKEETGTQLNEIKNRIADLESKVNSLHAKSDSLSSQINVIDNQINLTRLRINATQQEIKELENDIKIADSKVGNLEESLEDITQVLLKRIVATYQIGSIQPIQMLLTSNGVGDFLARSNYLKIVQAHDKKLIYDTQQAKLDYENQKEIYEQKKIRVVALNDQLKTQTAQLDKDVKSKQELLEVTKNDEAKYQGLLAAARAERNAIEGVISSLELKDGTPVSKGQVIAVVGNSGAPYCSTGPHLHLEVRRNGGYANPSEFLRGGVNFSYSYGPEQYGYYGSISPSGSWDWPLSEPIVVNQGYGSHGYAASFYPSGIHTGLDLDSNSSSLITAPTDGTLYKGSATCGGAQMNYVALDHGGGIVSWYWHVR